MQMNFLEDVKKYITFRTTSDLENFQNHILMCAAKCFAYSPKVYTARTQLTAIDDNYHNVLDLAHNNEGQKIYKRYYNIKSKNLSVYALKDVKACNYIPELQKTIVSRRLESGVGPPQRRSLRRMVPEALHFMFI
ncbi:hypothetical protein WMY93_001652 [Mugilogobius chulae]|uniref:Uncharacterized protein n=1 Tax=Mugilogobius chulae TaxID=88201 RepID=A0AAW0PXC1_9GOBI